MKRSAKPGLAAFIGLFLALSILPSAGMLAAPTTRAVGNEQLALWPQFHTADGGWNRAYLSEVSDYLADHIAFRHSFATLYARLCSGVFGTLPGEDVVLGREGWLYYAETLPDYQGTAQLTQRQCWAAARALALIQEYCQGQGVDFVFTIAPNKNSIYPQYMPARYRPAASPGNASRLADCLEEEVKKLTEEELDALADFVFEKIVAEAQAAAEEVAPKNNREDAATSAGKTEVEFPGETACEPESRSESCEPEGAGMETAAVAETAPSDSSEVSATRVANGPEATDYEEDEEDDDAPSMWDKMQRRPILTTLCAILFLLLILAGGTLWNLNRRGITLSDAWNYYFPTEQPSVAETAREATPHSTEEETLPAENNPAPTVVSEKETTPVADPVDVQALPPIAVHRLGRGDRLTLLALEFYGSKDFWVYIYEENKDVMPNPNRLSIGLEVKIPDPRKYAIDADSPSSLAKAKAFADALNEKFD